MVYRNWKLPKDKTFTAKNKVKKSKSCQDSKDEMKSAKKDADNLKRKKKRLTIDWFFRPQGD
jgi:hypothetical protein